MGPPLILAILVGLLSWFPSSAQSLRVGVTGQIQIAELNQMEQELSVADPDQKIDLLVRLGVDPVLATRAVVARMPGEEIALRPLRRAAGESLGVVFLPDGTRGYAALYLLEQTHDAGQSVGWKAIDHLQPGCWRVSCSFELAPVENMDADDILLHHVNQGHGSGMVTDNTELFSPVHGRLRRVLSTHDYDLEDEIGGPERIRSSTFLPMPDGALEESRSTSLDDRLSLVERRYWTWSTAKQQFTPSRFQAVATRTH